MARYVNRSIGVIEIGGEPTDPGKVTANLTAAQEKDANVVWLIENGFLVKGDEEQDAPRATPVSIPSPEEAAAGEVAVMSEEGTAPTATKRKG